MVTTKLNLSMTEPQVRQIYAKQGDTGRVLDITLDQTPEDGTLRILRPDGVEVTSEAVTGGEVESGGTFESLTEADVTELTVGVEPVQDLSHGDPSPSNICPITGWTGCNVTRAGKNLLEVTAESVTTKGVTFTVNSDGSVLVDGTATETVSFHLNRALQLPNGSFILSGCPSGGSSRNGYSLQGSGGPPYDVGAGSSSFSKITGRGIRIRIASDVSCNNLLFKPMIRLASDTDSAYEPYQGSTYTTSLGQTVYGGTLDMVSGVLTVTHGNIASYNGETLPSTWISDRDVYASGTTPTTGAQVVYELATPLTYQLTAQQIKTLVGTNNVWASSGDIVSIKFTYGGLLSELPSDATSIVGKCYCDVEQNGVSSMPFTLNVKKNERES